VNEGNVGEAGKTDLGKRLEGRLTDLEAYARLIKMVGELERLAARCWSMSSSTSLRAASAVVRQLASALFRAADGGR
jgi:hypothetical protein